MKKFVVFILLFVNTLVVSAQQGTIQVSYSSVRKVTLSIDVNGYPDEVKRLMEEELKKMTEQRETSKLVQSGTRSNYTITMDSALEPLLTKHHSSEALTSSSKFGNVQNIYLDLGAKEKLVQKKFMDKSLLVKEVLTSLPQWEIGTETKEILGRRCTKATLTVARSLTSHSDKRSTLKDTTETYTAWFCSEIAIPFGPEGLYGLPGLILESKINSKITTATRVEYLPQSQEILPPKGTIVTPEQYNKLLEESLTRFLETNENTEWEIEH